MNDCIDRRGGDTEALLCDDANQARRRAHDHEGWIAAARAALRVVSHLNRNQSRIKQGKEWADQAMDCLHRAGTAAGRDHVEDFTD